MIRTMPEAIAFDTHRSFNRVTEEQAEPLAGEHVALLNVNLATEIDIESLRQETKAAIEARADIAGVETVMEARGGGP